MAGEFIIRNENLPTDVETLKIKLLDLMKSSGGRIEPMEFYTANARLKYSHNLSIALGELLKDGVIKSMQNGGTNAYVLVEKI